MEQDAPTESDTCAALHQLVSRIDTESRMQEVINKANELAPRESQLLIDCLSMALDKNAVPPRNWAYVWGSLIKVASSAKVFAQNHTLSSDHVLSGNNSISSGVFRILGGDSVRVEILNQTQGDAHEPFSESLVGWAHLSHPNILPLYAVFFEGENNPSLIYPLVTNGCICDYVRNHPEVLCMPLVSDMVNGLSHMHQLNLVHGGLHPIYYACNGLEYVNDELGFCYGSRPLTSETVLISNEGRAVLAQFSTSRLFTEFGATASPYELRFAAPGLKNCSGDDIWAFGCLCYEVLSQKQPYHQYTEAAEVQSAVNQGEVLRRPSHLDNDSDEIDDEAWDLIMQCCRPDRETRLDYPEIQEVIMKMMTKDSRSEAEILPGADILMLRSRPDVDFPRIEMLLDKIQVDLLRRPPSKLVQSRTKDVAAAAEWLESDDTQILVDFLDLAFTEHISISEERNRVLALLSRITSSMQVFPQRYELRGIKYEPTPFAEGGFGKVYRASDQSMCVKVMAQADPKSLVEWIKELVLWAHLSHPNVLAFYGVFFEEAGNSSSSRMCLVSPYMKNRNLYEYAPKLSQKARLPLILDVINGLYYLHGLGIVHSDLKGQNVLISDEGRGLITDFGASHILTATAAATGSSVYSTLRFSAPEVIQGGVCWRPTKESDIWSFGCLCYQVLSRRVPYYEYKLDIQVSAALARKEILRRPGSTDRGGNDETDEDEWDDDYLDEDWDPIDDQSWNLITKCCTPELQERLKIPAIRELITDMKVWDDRSPVKAVPGAEIFKLRLSPDIDLNRAGELLDELQAVVCPFETDPQPSFATMYNKLE